MLLLFYTSQGLTSECMNFAHAVYLRIPHSSGNIETVFPSTAFAGWSF